MIKILRIKERGTIVIKGNKKEPKFLILLMRDTPDANTSQGTRAIAIFNEVRKIIPESYIILKKGEEEIQNNNYILIKPTISLNGRARLLREVLFIIQMTFFICQFIERKNITAIYLRGYHTILLFPYLKIKGIKILLDYHGRYDLELIEVQRFLRALLVKICDSIILRLSDKIFAVSAGIIEQIPHYKNKTLLLPNSVDIDAIQKTEGKIDMNIPADTTIIGFIGNWESFMKIEDICDSIKNNPKSFIAVIVGWGYNANNIIKKYSPNKNIIFTGRIYQKAAYSYLKLMDICIIPYSKNDLHSQYKDFFSAKKTKEYLAAGKPIIVAEVSGREQFLVNGINCLTYNPGDSEDLLKKILFLKENPMIAKKMGENNLELAKEFSWSKIVSDSGLIQEIIS